MTFNKTLFITVLVLFCFFIDAKAKSPILLKDVTKDAGITFQHTDGGSGQRYIMETVSAGLALFDYDVQINSGDKLILEGSNTSKGDTYIVFQNSRIEFFLNGTLVVREGSYVPGSRAGCVLRG